MTLDTLQHLKKGVSPDPHQPQPHRSRFATKPHPPLSRLHNPIRSADGTRLQGDHPSYLDTYGTNEQTGKGVDTRRIHREAQRLDLKGRTVDLLRAVRTLEGDRIADKMDRCGREFQVLSCGDHIIRRTPLYACDHRLCPFCSVRRSLRAQAKYRMGLKAYADETGHTPCLLTLTQTHRVETALASRRRLLDAWKKLTRRRLFKTHFKGGGLYAVEYTVDAQGLWHCHLHAIVFRASFIDVDALRAEWLEVTGDSHILRLDLIRSLDDGVKEVLKYMTKLADVMDCPSGMVAELLDLRGKRMYDTFGEFRAFMTKFDPDAYSDADERDDPYADLTEGDPCPHCSNPLMDVWLDREAYGRFLMRVAWREGVPWGGIPPENPK